MRDALVVGILLVGLGWSAGANAARLAEVGVHVQLSHHPLRTGGSIDWSTTLSLYSRLSVGDAWSLRATVGTPWARWLPEASLSATCVLDERWAIEGQLWIQTDLEEYAIVSLQGGGRIRVASSPSTRWMLASFPLGLIAYHMEPIGWQITPSFGLGIGLDLTWWATEHLTLGQAVTASLISLGPETPFAFPLTESLGLNLGAQTRAGYRP